MTRDTRIFEIIEKELTRQQEGVELIASENFTSKQVMEAMGSCLTNKYAEGYPGRRYYGGCQFVDEAEQLAIDRACALFGADYANVQPHSGAQANTAVFSAIMNPGDTFLGLDLAHGGHLTHGSPVNISGKWFRQVSYGVNPETGRVEYDEIARLAEQHRPKVIIVGASAYSRDWDYAAFRKIADSIGALVMADIAHPAGLIAAGLLNDPVPHCHILTTTTHKTLRGPRGGMIMIGRDFENPFGIKTPKGEIRMMSSLIDTGVFPGTQGGPLEHVIAAKAVAFFEALTPDFKAYGKQVIANAKAMARFFSEKGYKIISDGTDNHLMLIDLRSKNISGKKAETILGNADITVNKNMVPFDDKSPFVTSGIRIGTPAMTTRGMKEDHLLQIAAWIDEIITNPDDETLQASIKSEVHRFMKDFPLY